MIPPMDEEDPCVDVELARLYEWWKAELAQIVASGFSAEVAARSMLVMGFTEYAKAAGIAAAAKIAGTLSASGRRADGQKG